MDSDFYKKARKWYNTLYVNPASERIVYFVVFVLSVVCLYQTYQVANIIRTNKNYKNTYVLLLNHKESDQVIKITQVPPSKDQSLSLLKLIVEKYVLNMETLKYSGNETGIDAIRKKTIIIKNLSGKEVYDNYLSNTYATDNSDMSLSVLKLQKIAAIEKVEFIYENVNIFEKLYSLIASYDVPKGAKVYFSVETTSEKNRKQYFVATMNFNYYIDSDRKADSTIDFKVNDYFVEVDKRHNSINN